MGKIIFGQDEESLTLARTIHALLIQLLYKEDILRKVVTLIVEGLMVL